MGNITTRLISVVALRKMGGDRLVDGSLSSHHEGCGFTPDIKMCTWWGTQLFKDRENLPARRGALD